MKDLISRQAAIEALEAKKDKSAKGVTGVFYNAIIQNDIDALKALPSTEPDDAALHESCTDCPLYDHDKHRCPRFNKVIPTTIQEILDTQTQRWIPVTERMPEEHEWIGTKTFGTTISDEVYVTFESPKGERFTKHLSFQNGKVPSFEQRKIDAWHKGSVPIAWMPLPEPARLERD